MFSGCLSICVTCTCTCVPRWRLSLSSLLRLLVLYVKCNIRTLPFCQLDYIYMRYIKLLDIITLREVKLMAFLQ